MRIISGTHGGRLIKPPSYFKARPTTDLAKEALFNILSHSIDLDGITVLDLFAGTGSISFEFASRGAREVICVEKNSRYAAFIEKQASDFSLNGIRVVRMDAFRFLKEKQEGFDVIFADPPYDLKELQALPNAVFQQNHLKEGGLFILEHPSEYDFSKHPQFTELRRYSKVHFSFFQA